MHERTGAAGDRVESAGGRAASMIRVELAKLFRRPRTWVTIAACSTRCPRWSRCCSSVTGIAPPPGEGPAFLSAVLANGVAVRRRGAGDRAAAVPARGRGAWSPATRSRARRRPARCATCWSARSGGPGCWWPSSSRRSPSCWSRCWPWPWSGFVVGRLLLGNAAAVAGDRQRVRDLADRRPDRLADAAGDRLRRLLDARRRRDGAVAVHPDRLARWPRASARWRSSSARRCC